MPRGKTIDPVAMVDYLKTTSSRFMRRRKDNIQFSEMIFQMDNARPHTAMITQRYLTPTGVSVVKQSPYSPDMNLCDRNLFRYVKNELKNIPFDFAK